MRIIIDEKGQGLSEYGLILVLVSISMIVLLNLLKIDLDGLFDIIFSRVTSVL